MQSESPNYYPVSDLGHGVFGYVLLVQDKVTKKKYAVKRIQRKAQQLSRQYQILKILQGNQNIVKMQNYYFTHQNSKLIQNIVLEYIEDNLEKVIFRSMKNQSRIKEHDIKSYMYQILSGLAWIHSKKIAHRDLKPENILVTSDGTVKICDFGSSKVINPNGINTPYIVSRYYRAPELIFCISKYSFEIDIWAAGCILAQLYLHKPLFVGKTEGDQLFKIFQVMGQLNSSQIKYYESNVPFDRMLLKQFENYKRQNLQQKFQMSTDRKRLLDLLQKMLCYHPKNRISATEALKHAYFDCITKKQIQRKNIDLQTSTTSCTDIKQSE